MHELLYLLANRIDRAEPSSESVLGVGSGIVQGSPLPDGRVDLISVGSKYTLALVPL